MKKHISSFNKGIQQDISVNKYSNQNFYWAQNFRIVSKDGLATGALTNVSGTLPKLNFGGDGAVNIIGTCLIRDTLITFVSTEDGGKIYKWEYDSNDALESPTLIYASPGLNFRTEYPIRAVGRYENEDTQKVYFTDGDSFFKHINIVDPLLSTYDVDSLDLVSDVTFSNIDLELEVGGNLKAGKIQYAYQLYSVRGSESGYSPTSKLIHLTTADETKNSFDYHGSEVGEEINKSVRITIEDIDPLFTRIRIVALEYTVLYQIPSVRIVGEYDISEVSDLIIVDTGLSIGELTLEEYRFIQNNFYPKTIDVKDDYLFAANIKNEYFEITDEEFDARAFRADLNDDIKVYNGDAETIIPYPFTTLPDHAKEQFNKFNDIGEDYTGNLADNDNSCKYRPGSTGTILGGKGVNISYEFITDQVILDDSVRVNSWGEGYPQLSTGASVTVNNHANPQTKIGYHRDEIYRFGIVFFDLKGRQSFVKWIGDIRFPNNIEMPYIEYDENNQRTLANILGINFEVNVSSISDKISGYQIVRAERTNSDKTILAQGLVGYPIHTALGQAGNDNHLYSMATQPLVRDCYNKYSSYDRGCEDYKGQVTTPSGQIQYASSDIKMDDTYLHFESPDIVINKSELQTADAFIDVFGYQNNVENISIYGERGFEDVENNDDPCPNASDIITADKVRDFSGDTNSRIKTNISNFRLYRPKSVGLGGDADDDATKEVIDSGQIYNNQAYTPIKEDTGESNCFDEKSKWGLRGTHALLNIDTPMPLDTSWIDDADPIRFLIANYKIDKGRSIYGGSSSQARNFTKYYIASSFNKTIDISVDVYNGDTYISYFNYMRSIYDNQVRTNGYRIESYVFFPVESTINLELRLDKMQDYINWGFYRDSGVTDYKLMETTSMGVATYGLNYPTELGDLYRYNSAYSVTDKSKEFIAKPFDFQNILYNDTRILASEKKINGEYLDQWTIFKFNNNLDVDSKHNAITKILTFKNSLFYFQATAVGIASVNQRSLIKDGHPEELSLGTGGILTRFDYVTEKSGSEFYDSILSSDDFLFYADGRRKRINKLVPGKEEAISLIKGIDSTLDKQSFEKVRAGFDRGYNEVIFSIDDNLTISFSEPLDAFVSSYTFNPKFFVSIGKDLFSVGDYDDDTPWLVNGEPAFGEFVGIEADNDSDPNWVYAIIGGATTGETLFKHNAGPKGEFYGDVGEDTDSYITLIINPNDTLVNAFDNLDIRTEATDSSGDDVTDDIFYRLEASNGYQEFTKELSFSSSINESSGTIKRIGRVWRVPLLPNQTTGASFNRMVDTYIKVTLRYANGSNTFRLHDVILLYRTSRV